MIVAYYGMYKLRRTKFVKFARRMLSVFVKEWRQQYDAGASRSNADILVDG